MRYLLTPTLLNSWVWLFQAPGLGEKPVKDFELILNKKSITDNKHMAAGREFENAVEQFLRTGKSHKDCLAVKNAAAIVRGGTYQVSGARELNIDDMTFLLYARADYLRGPYVFDLKNVNRYESGKYRESFQHKVYFHVFPGTLYCQYVINHNGSILIEQYSRLDNDRIILDIQEFSTWLKSRPRYLEIYLEKWQALGERKNA